MAYTGKKPETRKTPQEFINTATHNQLECRAVRHAWDLNKGTVESIGPNYKWTMPCMRHCSTVKVITIRKRTGAIVRTSYHWQKGYRVKGGLRKQHLNAIRTLLIEEILS